MRSIAPRVVKSADVIGMFVFAFAFFATPMLVPSVGNAQDARVAKSMAALKDQTTKLGAPKIAGNDAVGGRDAPALYFGSTKMNNNFSVVDAVAEEGGRGMAATLFVKSGDDYIRVATNVSTRIGSWRGIGTVLSGAPLESIKAGNAYYGKAPAWDALYQRLRADQGRIGCYHWRLLRRLQEVTRLTKIRHGPRSIWDEGGHYEPQARGRPARGYRGT